MTNCGKRLLDLPAAMSRGSSTGADNIFMLVKNSTGFVDREGRPVEIDREILRRPIYATDFNRYRFRPTSNERIIFPYVIRSNGYGLMPESELRRDYPLAYDYLRSRRKELEKRKQFSEWYGFSAPRSLDMHDAAHLVVPLLANRGMFAKLPNDRSKYCLMASGGFSISVPDGVSPTGVLAVLNSKLLFWFLQRISNRFRGGWITCTKQYVGELPIHQGIVSRGAGEEFVEQLTKLADRIISLEQSRETAKTPQQKTHLERQLTSLDRQIDQVVYQLYGLSDAEIDIVEGAVETDAEVDPEKSLEAVQE